MKQSKTGKDLSDLKSQIERNDWKKNEKTLYKTKTG